MKYINYGLNKEEMNMEVVNLIKECIKDCAEVILKRIEESDTLLDDMILEKIKQLCRFIRVKL